MAVIELVEPTAAQQQLNNYNSNVGGNLNLCAEFPSVPASTVWGVYGFVFAPDPVTPAMVTGTLIPGLEALAAVTSVNGDQLLGQSPATIEAADHEMVLHVSSKMLGTIGGVDSFGVTREANERQVVPLGKWWAVLILRLDAELPSAGIAALETAAELIAGVTKCEHLVDGVISSRSSAASLEVKAHMRIDPIPEV